MSCVCEFIGTDVCADKRIVLKTWGRVSRCISFYGFVDALYPSASVGVYG